MVTCRSSMASSSADCVFGVDRLISSAEQHVREDRPFSSENPDWEPFHTRMPVMSDGIRSAVNSTRLHRSR